MVAMVLLGLTGCSIPSVPNVDLSSAGRPADGSITQSRTLMTSETAPSESVELPSRYGTTALAGLCHRMPISLVVAWQHASHKTSADADGCSERIDASGTATEVDYTVAGRNVVIVTTGLPDEDSGGAQAVQVAGRGGYFYPALGGGAVLVTVSPRAVVIRA